MRLIIVILSLLFGTLSVSHSFAINSDLSLGNQQFHKHKTVQEKFPSPTTGTEADLFDKIEDDDSVSEHLEFKFAQVEFVLYSLSTSYYLKPNFYYTPTLQRTPLFIRARKLLI